MELLLLHSYLYYMCVIRLTIPHMLLISLSVSALQAILFSERFFIFLSHIKLQQHPLDIRGNLPCSIPGTYYK